MERSSVVVSLQMLLAAEGGPERGDRAVQCHSRLSCDVGVRSSGLVPRSRQDAYAAVGPRGASPSWQELPRSATPIAKIGSKGPPDRAARTLPQPNLRSAFRRIAFVPLYRRKALLAGPVHDNKKHANTDRPHKPKESSQGAAGHCGRARMAGISNNEGFFFRLGAKRRLRGWACRTRTQKRRRKLSL